VFLKTLRIEMLVRRNVEKPLTSQWHPTPL